jgi:hypothetical protein
MKMPAIAGTKYVSATDTIKGVDSTVAIGVNL